MIKMPIDREKYLYHFTKSETALLHILPSLKLKLTSYLDSNDPKENKTFGFGAIYRNCDPFNISKIQTNFENYVKEYCKHLCFSSDYIQPESNFWINGFDHPTMWAHYADNSKGVCLAIDKVEFLKENPGFLFDPVEYQPYFEFPSLNQTKWESDSLSYFESFLRLNKESLFYKKHSHWNIEHELKIVELGNREYCTIEKSLKGIYLGTNFDKNHILALKRCQYKDLWFRKIGISDGSFYAFPVIELINE